MQTYDNCCCSRSLDIIFKDILNIFFSFAHNINGDKMKDNIDFLNYIYQNARMGIVGIENIEEKITNIDLKKIIKEQLNDYEAICDEVVKIFVKYNKKEKDINSLAKINTYLSSNFNLIGKDPNQEIAKLMIKGSNTGIIEINENLNKYKEVDEKIIKIAKKLLKIEEKNLEELKPYL